MLIDVSDQRQDGVFRLDETEVRSVGVWNFTESVLAVVVRRRSRSLSDQRPISSAVDRNLTSTILRIRNYGIIDINTGNCPGLEAAPYYENCFGWFRRPPTSDQIIFRILTVCNTGIMSQRFIAMILQRDKVQSTSFGTTKHFLFRGLRRSMKNIYLHRGGHVFTCVFLSVCLLTGFLEHYWSNLYEGHSYRMRQCTAATSGFWLR